MKSGTFRDPWADDADPQWPGPRSYVGFVKCPYCGWGHGVGWMTSRGHSPIRHRMTCSGPGCRKRFRTPRAALNASRR